MYSVILNPQVRSHIRIGSLVAVVLKRDQRSGRLTEGLVAEILTNSSMHPRGIKVRLADGRVGRVQKILAIPAKNVPLEWHI